MASMGINPEGSRFVTGGWDGAIHVWRTGARLRLPCHYGQLAFT